MLFIFSFASTTLLSLHQFPFPEISIPPPKSPFPTADMSIISAAPTPTILLLFFFAAFSDLARPLSASTNGAGISLLLSEKGLDFAKNVLIDQAKTTVVPLILPDIEKVVNIPFLGGVDVVASNVTITEINVSSSSSSIHLDDAGVVIIASGCTASLRFDWGYSYATWWVPVEVSDEGSASVRVEGMGIGLAMSMESKKGTLKLTEEDIGCYLRDIIITLDGGASWFYQGFINAFKDQIRYAVQKAIVNQISSGILRLDSLLQRIPREIKVNDVVSLNVTFMNDPLLGSSSIEFDIDGLFNPSVEAELPMMYAKDPQRSFSCGRSTMVAISLDEAVFNSGSALYHEAGFLQWTVDEVPDQSLLNTAAWKFIIPRLYLKYPNDDMLLNISLSSPPLLRITPENIDTTVLLDMVVDIMDKGETIPVACLSVDVSASGMAVISANNLAGKVELKDFSLALKWSKIGDFHTSLIQAGLPSYVATRALYNLKPPTVFVPSFIKEDVEKLLDIHRNMSKDELNVDLIALDIGETYEIRNDLVVRPFRTNHVIPSQGYVIYSIRKKLKKQYAHLKGPQIKKLKFRGVEITDMIICPEIAFTGDTTAEFILEPRSADALRAKVLITEATFIDEKCDIDHARSCGHMHLLEIMEHSQWFRNKAILLTHFSNRYTTEEIREATLRLQPNISAKIFTLTEGFRSMYK